MVFSRFGASSVPPQALDALRLLRGWQALPAAVLVAFFITGIVGLVVRPHLVSHAGTVHYNPHTLLSIAGYFASHLVPASLIGIAIGWALARIVSGTPRPLRYAAYLIMAAWFIPAIASYFSVYRGGVLSFFPVTLFPSPAGGVDMWSWIVGDSSVSIVRTEPFFLADDLGALTHLFKVLFLTTIPIACTFLVMTFKYSFVFSNQPRVSTAVQAVPRHACLGTLAARRHPRSMAPYVAFTCLVSLSLVVLAVLQNNIFSREFIGPFESLIHLGLIGAWEPHGRTVGSAGKR